MSNNNYRSYSLTIPNLRIAFPSLFKYQTDQFGNVTNKYGAAFYLDKRYIKTKELIDKKIAELLDYYKNEKIDIEKKFITDGDTKSSTYTHGSWVIKANDNNKPEVYDIEFNRLTEETNIIYPGCYVKAEFEIAFFKGKNPSLNRISAYLKRVIFQKDGERFLGNKSTEDIDSIKARFNAVEESEYDIDDL